MGYCLYAGSDAAGLATHDPTLSITTYGKHWIALPLYNKLSRVLLECSRIATLLTMKGIEKKFKKLKARISGSNHQLDHEANHSPIPMPTHRAPTSDDSADRSRSVTSTTLVGTQAGLPEKPRKFVEVKTTNAQHDLVVLHVAYILQKSSNLQCLILEIVKLGKKRGVRQPPRCSSA